MLKPETSVAHSCFCQLCSILPTDARCTLATQFIASGDDYWNGVHYDVSATVIMCFTVYQYCTSPGLYKVANYHYIRWLSLPSTVSLTLAQSTFERSACQSPMSFSVASLLCQTSLYVGSSNKNSVWMMEFPHCCSSHLKLVSDMPALCLH